jgi:hypothetical protein
MHVYSHRKQLLICTSPATRLLVSKSWSNLRSCWIGLICTGSIDLVIDVLGCKILEPFLMYWLTFLFIVSYDFSFVHRCGVQTKCGFFFAVVKRFGCTLWWFLHITRAASHVGSNSTCRRVTPVISPATPRPRRWRRCLVSATTCAGFGLWMDAMVPVMLLCWVS